MIAPLPFTAVHDRRVRIGVVLERERVRGFEDRIVQVVYSYKEFIIN